MQAIYSRAEATGGMLSGGSWEKVLDVAPIT